MKKNLKMIFIFVVLLIGVIPIIYSYAMPNIAPEKNEKQFFEIAKTEVVKNQKVEMVINLDSINYNEFIFELQSNEDIGNLEITQSDEVTAQKNNNEIVMQINKEKANVKTINLYYKIPENKEVGDTIKFIATITSIINNESEPKDPEQNELITEKEEMDENNAEQTTELEETGTEEEVLEKNETDNKTNEPKQETQSIELEVKIIEEDNDTKKEDNVPQFETLNKEDNKQQMENNQKPNTENLIETNVQTKPNSYPSVQYSSMNNLVIDSNQTAIVTYKGSDNNYLKKLSVNGYTLNRKFSKENTTYFIDVDEKTEKIDIKAIAEDDEAIVCIYGNEELKNGTNKILITVTAENGNIRNYRIYVTKNG